jgi:tetratricopeptide (TPR) repeat protein
MEAITQLTRALTGKEKLEDCSESELRKMVRLYPFFGPAQLLLARKTKDGQDEEAKEIESNAALFVPNALWFGRLMSNQVNETLADYTETIPHETILEEPATVEEVVEQSATVTEEHKEEIVGTVFTEETVLEEPFTEEEVIEQVSEAPEVEEQDEMDDVIEEAVQEESFVAKEDVVEQTFQSPVEEEQDLSEDFTANQSGSITVEDIVKEKMPELEGLPPIPTFKIEPLEPGKMELSFEPYHTVDYFASQGIRFRDDEKPKDRLSLQLKSFTEWLKTLKKAPEAEIPAAATRQEEKKVEQMAQVSIADPAVVTEAMAEVWEKQGNTIKAIELYKKLSLLDPDKNAYFASKIEHLKQL